jgi:hypothetical protein
MSSKVFDVTQENNEWYNIKRGDSVQLIQDLQDESIGLSVFSLHLLNYTLIQITLKIWVIQKITMNF